MKFLLGLIATLMIATSIAIPVNNPNDDAENIEVAYPERNSEETESVYTPFLVPISISPYSFFDTFEDYFRSIRQRLLSRFLEAADTLELDPSKANSTSETRIINGHRVEINNTVYVDKDENGDEVVKVRVLHIRPLDLDDSTTISSINADTIDEDEKTIKPKAEGTTAEPDFDNEIDSPKNSTGNYTETETEPEPIFNLLQGETSDVSIKNKKYKISKKNIQPLYYEIIPTENLNEEEKSDSVTYVPVKIDDNIENEFINHNDDNDMINVQDLSSGSIDLAGGDNDYVETTNENVKAGESTETIDNSKSNTESYENDDDDDDDDDDNDDDDKNYDIVETNKNTEPNESTVTIETTESNSDDISNENLEKENYYHRSRENFHSSEEEETAGNNDYDYGSHIKNKYESLNNEWFLTPEDYYIDKDNNYDNDIDTYESIPIDLSNDINVNYIAQKNGAKIDPDAEIFLQNNSNNNYYDDDDVIKSLPPSFEDSLEESIHNNGNDNNNENENNENISERKTPIK